MWAFLLKNLSIKGLKLRLLFLFLGASSFIFGSANKYASIVVDGSTGKILHGVNEEKKRFPASLTKKMTLYILFEALKNKRITLQTRIPVSARAVRQCPSKIGFQVSQSISVESAIKSLVVKSANDVAVAVAEFLAGSVENFALVMSKKAQELGMRQTIFKNSSGVNDACTTDREQYTTAKDLSMLAIALYRDFPEFTHYFKLQSFQYGDKILKNHNHMLGQVSGLDGIKTGFANAPGFNISTSTVRYDKNGKPRRLFVVVMGGKSWRSRDRHAEQLIEHGFKLLGCPNTSYQAFPPEAILEDSVKIQNVVAKTSKPSKRQKALIKFLDKKKAVKKIKG
ncbi:MAG: hypothetical protein NEHIOOID_00005 [Holosporales bacterium]